MSGGEGIEGFDLQDEEERRDRERKKAIALQKRQEQDDLRAVMSTETGRRFVFQQVWNVGTYDTTIYPGQDPTYLAGRRSGGLQLEELILRTDMSLWLKMQTENRGKVLL